MSSSKRRLNEDIFSNKIRRSTVDQNKEITRFEELSNEILYDIFDYLDASDIFYGFLSLNTRFDRLIKDSSLPIQLTRSNSFNDMTNAHYQRLIKTNRHRIVSLYLQDKLHITYFTTLLKNYELFNRLECIVLEEFQYEDFESVLPHLRILPRLFSLKIDIKIYHPNITKLNELIFSLPVLKYNKISAKNPIYFIILPMIYQISSLEYLIFDFECSTSHLQAILACAPQLKHFSCKRLLESGNESLNLPPNVPHLRSIFIQEYHHSFDVFEPLAKRLFSRLEILHLSVFYNLTFIDLDRWERLILQNMPHLRILNFECSATVLPQIPPGIYHATLNRFISSFWIERKWFFELQLRLGTIQSITEKCFIQPLKKQWYDIPMITRQKTLDTPVLKLRLIVEETQLPLNQFALNHYVYLIVDMAQFTNLHIDFFQFSIMSLLQYLRHLPSLDSLTITSEFPQKNKIISVEHTDMFQMVLNHNKITKLSIERMTELDQVHQLMTLCPHLHYLQLTCRNIADAEWLIRYILTKQNDKFIPHLCLICITLSNADEIITNRLQKIIDNEKLVEHFKIFRICDRIYLQWNEHF